MIENLKQQFPEGTPVIVTEESKTGTGIYVTSEVIGTVINWRHETTGAWYSKQGDPSIPNENGKLQLLRLMIRKVDGEISDMIIDDLAKIAKLEAK